MPVIPGAEPFFHSGGNTGVLLCHGFTGSPASLRPWADHLATAGLTVSLPRLPGHGTTWQDMAHTRWEDWYAEVDRAYQTLAKKAHVKGFRPGKAPRSVLTHLFGPQVANDVANSIVTNTLPTSVSFLDARPRASFTNGSVITFKLGPLVSGQVTSNRSH